MTQKRFIVKKCDDGYCIFDAVDDMNCVCVCDVERIADKTCDLLNELNDEFELREAMKRMMMDIMR